MGRSKTTINLHNLRNIDLFLWAEKKFGVNFRERIFPLRDNGLTELFKGECIAKCIMESVKIERQRECQTDRQSERQIDEDAKRNSIYNLEEDGCEVEHEPVRRQSIT